jgi:hypothetical protein
MKFIATEMMAARTEVNINTYEMCGENVTIKQIRTLPLPATFPI